MRNYAPLKKIEGTVKKLNISPRGVYEGAVMQTAHDLIQINFGPEAGPLVSQHFRPGKKAAVMALPDKTSKKAGPAYPVFWLARVQIGKKNLDLNAKPARVSVTGKVKSLNFALHGEVNGALLDNGDFVHLKPEGAKAIGLSIGQKINVKGETSISYVPHRIIEARVVNGVDIRSRKKQPDHHG